MSMYAKLLNGCRGTFGIFKRAPWSKPAGRRRRKKIFSLPRRGFNRQLKCDSRHGHLASRAKFLRERKKRATLRIITSGRACAC